MLCCTATRFMSSNTDSWEAVLAAAAADPSLAALRKEQSERGIVLLPFVEACVLAASTLRDAGILGEMHGAGARLPSATAATVTTASWEGQPLDAPRAQSEQAEGAGSGGDAGAAVAGQEAEEAVAGGGEAVAGGGEAAEGVAAEAGAMDSPPAPAPAPALSTQHSGGGAEPEALAAGGPPPLLPPAPPSTALLAACCRLSTELSDVLRSTVKPDTVMVVPSLPYPPPLRDSVGMPEAHVFEKLGAVFHCFASLAGCPVVTVPVGMLRDGSPVAISMFGVHKWVEGRGEGRGEGGG